ncbi:dihydrolipoamide acetyltransferase family protein [Cytophaga aurantiaca]|uniref:dihydrolipoamide acetyltransferase family protein n=1 Tax=Cytophaga aurantiaca TaxID=29530 RepID=UPI0003625FE5|nr:dihydrolipoamide acetyltransferase family protein [Cytophaga aurantiaca]
MALVELVMPKMGESVMEGTILTWLKKPGDRIQQDESVLEVATDKVDTEVPSPFNGILKEIRANQGDVVQVGTAIAIIETEVNQPAATGTPVATPTVTITPAQPAAVEQKPVAAVAQTHTHIEHNNIKGGKFYSPLVLNIARQENISLSEVEQIAGSGKDGRVTKHDLFDYIQAKKDGKIAAAKTENIVQQTPVETKAASTEPAYVSKPASSSNGNVEIVQMDRMRKMIADRMVESKRISPHVTSFVEADVTNIVYWRNRWKNDFMERENVALTFTPIFIEAVVKAIKDYPMVNISIEDDKILVKRDINIGIAVALPNGNLIVPVIKHADQLNIVGLTKKVNDLAKRARQNKLTADDLSGGTYTVSNVGSFGNLMGTPIIVQPQAAILALGAVIKKPAVIETPQGDTLGIRHMMFLSHSYDHRAIDGSLGGMFVRRVADYLEKFDVNRKIFV